MSRPAPPPPSRLPALEPGTRRHREERHEAQRAEIVRIDRALARLESVLTDRSDRSEGGATPGVVFAALRGDARQPAKILLSSHRVPMIWRRPARPRDPVPQAEIFALTSLLDIHPTLLGAAGLRASLVSEPNPIALAQTTGLSLDAIDSSKAEQRFILLGARGDAGEVGIASGRDVYVRAASAFDVSGSRVPTELLEQHAPRFLTRSTAATWSSVGTMLWRDDVLSTDSPVPRLEFHLARLLRGPEAAERPLQPTPIPLESPRTPAPQERTESPR